MGAEAPEPEVFTLNYSNAKDVEQQLAPLLSPKGTIQVDQRTNAMIVNDMVTLGALPPASLLAADAQQAVAQPGTATPPPSGGGGA